MKHETKLLLAVLCIFGGLGLALVTPRFAEADDIQFNFRVSERVTSGDDASLTIIPSASLESIKLELKRSDGRTFSFDAKNLSARADTTFKWKQNVGSFKYQAELSSWVRGVQDPSVIQFEFGIICREPPEVYIDKGKTAVDEGKIILSANRPVHRIQGMIYDDRGNLMGQHDVAHGRGFGTAGPVEFAWNQPGERSVKKVELQVYDSEGFWKNVSLLPFWVEIPHKTVVFETGKWEVRSSEVSKLDESLVRIREEMAKYGDELKIKLFVAGYTDTVGTPESNMTLSNNRSKAIAQWFRAAGLDIPIHYQGFGESVLAVSTGDSVDEERNRRALYILGNTAPPLSAQIPARNWKALN